MSDTFKASPGAAVAALQGILDALPEAQIRLYGGPVPQNAQAGLGAAVLLCTITGPSEEALSLVIDGTTLQKDPDQVWSGEYAASGTVSFYRLVNASDNDGASSSAVRFQGVGGQVNADLNLVSLNVTQGAPQNIKEYVLGIKQAQVA